MAKYTIELRRVCDYYTREEVENWFKDYDILDYLTVEQYRTIEESKMWNKNKLAKKIVDHYYMREIGFETPALFKHYAKVTMQEIMEEKLPLIYTNAIEYNPLINVDYTETFSRKVEGESSGKNKGNSNSNSSNNSSGLNIASDTPQGQINKQDILNGGYASSTNASETKSNINDETNTSSEASSNSSSNEEYTRHFTGNQGISATYQAMIKQFRDNIVAIDRDIIKELNSLFMGLY